MNDSRGGSRKFLYIAVCTANLVALTAGIALGWSSPVGPKLTPPSKLNENPLDRVIDEDEESWFISILALGAICGPFLAGFSADKFGRKKTLIFCAGVPLLAAFLILAFAKTIALYYVARFICGFGIGAVFTVLPNFISEIAEDSIRGAICSSMNVFVVSGPLFSYVVGPYLPIMWFSIVCAIVPIVFVVLFFLLVPESPYYLIAINDSQGALNALKKIRSASESEVAKELESIKLSVEASLSNKGSFIDIFKSRALTKALIISLTLVGFQQFSGINVVQFNAQSIFEATGGNIPAEISPMIVGAVQIGASLVTPLMVDRLGRKPLHLISAVGMLVAEVPLGLYFYLQDNGTNVNSISWLPVVCLVVYIAVYNFGFGPLPWTVMAEIFPSNVKAAASTATASFCWILGFILTKFFTQVSNEIGLGGSFWLFSGFCALAIVFVLTYLIETKGKSFQEIQDILAK